MPGLDIFVLIVLVVSAVVVILIAGALPGMVARSRDHPQAQAVTAAGWVTLSARWQVRRRWTISIASACRTAASPARKKD